MVDRKYSAIAIWPKMQGSKYIGNDISEKITLLQQQTRMIIIDRMKERAYCHLGAVIPG